jgi:hypothetical protein
MALFLKERDIVRFVRSIGNLFYRLSSRIDRDKKARAVTLIMRREAPNHTKVGGFDRRSFEQ